ncbi:MAG: VOC family protein [Candidatus Fimimonas sp.]
MQYVVDIPQISATKNKEQVKAVQKNQKSVNVKAQINLVTIWTNDVQKMKLFYTNVLGFQVESDLGNNLELKNDGVRFAICTRDVMLECSGEYGKQPCGQAFELAFPCESPADVDESFQMLVQKGATAVCPPKNMPWNQRTALLPTPTETFTKFLRNLISLLQLHPSEFLYRRLFSFRRALTFGFLRKGIYAIFQSVNAITVAPSQLSVILHTLPLVIPHVLFGWVFL